MGKFMRKCNGICEVAVMEVTQVGVRTRARTLAMAERRKNVSDDLQFNSSNIELRNRRKVMITPENSITPANSVNSGRVRRNSDRILVSRCSSNGSSEIVNERLRSVIDLEDSHEFENSPYRERTPSSELYSESNELESTGRQAEAGFRDKSSAETMPTDSEIEEFFSIAEKDEKKRFADKYNYDIEKDVPLEGRFEWIELKS